ncbi:hypothetical protein AVEN_32964-1 [Araneus ventricosus]|uniref:Uncharacterized protein n=1 Tax=Araneus ventricosus TaxID=182803 RepID=A0A4Y2INB8_ARAVE|nr:hypothetical protein AVEN_32964-1 [Araneus ventricosus]
MKRSQTRKTDPSLSREKEGKVVNAEEPAAVVGEELTVPNLLLAEKEDREMVGISSNELQNISNIGKIFEKIILSRLKEECHDLNIIPNKQYGLGQAMAALINCLG